MAAERLISTPLLKGAEIFELNLPPKALSSKQLLGEQLCSRQRKQGLEVGRVVREVTDEV